MPTAVKCTLIYLACAAILGACEGNPIVIRHDHHIYFGDKKAEKVVETIRPH